MAPPSAQHVVLLLQCILVLQAGGVVGRKGPVLLPESPCHRAEHPLISHTDMEPWIHRFQAEGTVDYSQLTFDPSQNELIVGARNHLFRLNREDLSLIQEAEWHCDEFTKGACFSRGKSEEECHNYIRVLLVNGDRLFTCGTNAFTPICTNRTVRIELRTLSSLLYLLFIKSVTAFFSQLTPLLRLHLPY
uniref:Sema domain-containing protein n=1 Tax=Hucho hucho TaxID=62062 RepID=A0A4W5QTU0_9TELE